MTNFSGGLRFTGFFIFLGITRGLGFEPAFSMNMLGKTPCQRQADWSSKPFARAPRLICVESHALSGWPFWLRCIC